MVSSLQKRKESTFNEPLADNPQCESSSIHSSFVQVLVVAALLTPRYKLLFYGAKGAFRNPIHSSYIYLDEVDELPSPEVAIPAIFTFPSLGGRCGTCAQYPTDISAASYIPFAPIKKLQVYS